MDCEKYQGRKRSICEGVESDGTPLKMTPAKRRAYLDRWEGKSEKVAEERKAEASRWMSWIESHARPGDRGVGDVVERLAAVFGGRLMKRAAKALGMDCGCSSRQEKLNIKYPFTASDS